MKKSIIDVENNDTSSKPEFVSQDPEPIIRSIETMVWIMDNATDLKLRAEACRSVAKFYGQHM